MQLRLGSGCDLPASGRAGGGAIVVFVPSSMFTAGEQGVWYEPDQPTALVTRRNLFLQSENLPNVAWNKAGATVVGDLVTFPSGSIYSAIVTQNVNSGGAAPGNNTISALLWTDSGTCRVRFKCTQNGVMDYYSAPITITTTPTRYSFTALWTAGTGQINAGLVNMENEASSFHATQFQFDAGSATPTAYQKVTDWNTEYLAAAGNNITLFQDSTGITPVTAVEQPVGLMLDKRLGLVRSSNYAPNADFAAGVGAWVGVAGGTVAADVGGLKVSSSGGSTAHGGQIDLTAPQNVTYELEFDVIAIASTARAYFNVFTGGGGAAGGVMVQATGRYRAVMFATPSGTPGMMRLGVNLRDRASAGNTSVGDYVTIDNVSFRELPGNHTTQATTAQKPVLSARKNLLAYSEDFTNAGWSKSNVTITANATTAPDGATTADKMVETAIAGFHYVSMSVSGDTNCTGSIYVKAGERTKVGFGSQGGLVINAKFDLTTGTFITNPSNLVVATAMPGGWYRLSVKNQAGSTVGPYVYTLDAAGAESYTGDGTSGVYVWGGQLEAGVVVGRYQRVNTATDYDTIGFPHYLKFDGVDDGMVSNSIDFTATDKMTVWVGVRKLSDALGMVVETSVAASTITQSGAMYLSAGNDAGVGYRAHAMGVVTTVAVSQSSGWLGNAPDTSVLGITHDISGDNTTLRRNGVAQASGTFDKGTGNFGNYPLYLGRRGGASLPFNGQLYVLSIRGASSTPGQITDGETYTAGKTGVTLP